LRQVQRSESVGFQRVADRRQLDRQRRCFGFGDDAGIVDQHVEMAAGVLQKIAQRDDAVAVRHIKQVKRDSQFLRRKFLHRRIAGGALARGQNNLGVACGELTANLQLDAPIAAGDDDDGSAPTSRQRRSLLVQELERVGPLVLGKA
jgi:hypothetical protein